MLYLSLDIGRLQKRSPGNEIGFVNLSTVFRIVTTLIRKVTVDFRKVTISFLGVTLGIW